MTLTNNVRKDKTFRGSVPMSGYSAVEVADAQKDPVAYLNRKWYRRIPFGSEKKPLMNLDARSIAILLACPICRAYPGEFHVRGCNYEECPSCHGQLNHCKCREQPEKNLAEDVGLLLKAGYEFLPPMLRIGLGEAHGESVTIEDIQGELTGFIQSGDLDPQKLNQESVAAVLTFLGGKIAMGNPKTLVTFAETLEWALRELLAEENIMAREWNKFRVVPVVPAEGMITAETAESWSIWDGDPAASGVRWGLLSHLDEILGLYPTQNSAFANALEQRAYTSANFTCEPLYCISMTSIFDLLGARGVFRPHAGTLLFAKYDNTQLGAFLGKVKEHMTRRAEELVQQLVQDAVSMASLEMSAEEE